MPRSGLPFGFDRRGMVWFAGRGAVVKSQQVCSPGKLHYDRVVAAIYAVILGEFPTEPPRLYPHHRVELGLEIIRAAEDFRRNFIFLNRDSRTVTGGLRPLAERFAECTLTEQNL